MAGGRHSWLYEVPAYRRAVARFLAVALGGPLDPETAGEVAAAVPATRLPDGELPFSAVEAEPGGIRSLAAIVTPRRAGDRGLHDEGLEDDAHDRPTGPLGGAEPAPDTRATPSPLEP